MSKHTPGPWKIGKHGSIIVDAPPSNDPDGVVQFYGGNVICESLASMEDARLIAAAPEMLEALTELYKAEWMVTHDWGGNRNSILAKVRAVIAKANGELCEHGFFVSCPEGCN